jgi:hypothetical protein|tara:strand:+ start:517 stop:618 length:102 start_codon:yes stop_codon:yes gene_type:complete
MEKVNTRFSSTNFLAAITTGNFINTWIGAADLI